MMEMTISLLDQAIAPAESGFNSWEFNSAGVKTITADLITE
jgi:hypothetical protein